MTALSKSYVVAAAIAAVVVTEFDLVDVQENYGYAPANPNPDQPMRENFGRGPLNTVQVVVSFPTTPPTTRNMTAWEGDAYLAVRGKWTDDTLRARIKEMLEAE